MKYICLFILLFSISLKGQDPNSITNLEFRLRSDTEIQIEDEKVSSWGSLINDLEATNENVLRRPSLSQNTFGDASGIKFGGNQAGAYLLMNPGLVSSSFTAFFLIKTADFTNPVQYFWGILPPTKGVGFLNSTQRLIFVNGSTEYTSIGSFDSNTEYLVKIKYNSTTQLFEIDVNFVTDGSSIVSELNPVENISIGTRSDLNWSFNGSIGEILYYSRAIELVEEEQVYEYFQDYYGPDLDLPNQIVTDDFCDFLLSTSSRYRAFTWSNGSDSASTLIDSPGILYLEVETIFGEVLIDSVEIVYPGNFLESFSLCTNQDSLWTTNLESFDVEWQDGTTTTDYLITEAGEYFLTVTDSEGCSYTSETIVVMEDFFPTETDLDENPTFCLGNDLFLSSGFAEAETYLWSTDETTPFIQPQASGEYWVEATNGNGCVGRDTVEIVIAGVAPEAALGFSAPCENSEVVFNDLTVPDGGTVVEWEWVFGSRVFDSAQTPEFGSGETPAFTNQYTETGAYPVTLTVTLDNGCKGTVRDTIVVKPLPLVNFSAPLVCAGNEVFFESLSGVPDNGAIAQWDWSFGNGTTDAGSIGSTTFEALGANTVTHTVTTADACVDSLSRNVEVLGSPIVDFDVADVCIGQTAIFNENVDVSVSGPVFYNWQFGDGFFSNFPNTSHEYAQPGVYSVTLTATGNNVGINGCTGMLTKTIAVYETPVANLLANDACLGAEANLVDVTAWSSLAGVADSITGRSWTITDGPTGSQQGAVGSDSSQVFVPNAAGTFDVMLMVETKAGCTATASGSFLVQEIPTAAFVLDLPASNPPFEAVPENLSEDGINFEWLVNGEAVSTEFEPTLSFESAGDYAIWLVATNDLNCNDSAKALYSVIVPEYDMELIDLQYETQGNTLIINAIIGNNGNVAVDRFDTEIEVGRGIRFTVESEFTIPPGQIMNYPLGSEIEYLPGRDLPYTCMRISNPNGEIETDTTNNYLCIGLNELGATFAAPYPNPANDEVKLAFVLPTDGAVSVEITGADGRLMETFVLDLVEGLNTVDYSLVGWSEGMYFLKFGFGNQEEVHRLVIAR